MMNGAGVDSRQVNAFILAMAGNPSYRPPIINDVDFVSSRASKFGGEAYSQKRIKKIGPKLQNQPKKKKLAANSNKMKKKKTDLSSSSEMQSPSQKKVHISGSPMQKYLSSSTVQIHSKDIENIFSRPLDYNIAAALSKKAQTARKKKRQHKNDKQPDKRQYAIYQECPYFRQQRQRNNRRGINNDIFQRENKRLENIVEETEKNMEKRMKYYKRTLDLYKGSPGNNLLPLKMDKYLRRLLALSTQSMLRMAWKKWRKFNEMIQWRIDYWNNLAKAIHEISSTFLQEITEKCIITISSQVEALSSSSDPHKISVTEAKRIECLCKIQAVWRGFVYGRNIMRKKLLKDLQRSLCYFNCPDADAVSIILNELSKDEKKTLYVCQNMMNKYLYLEYLPRLAEVRRVLGDLWNIIETHKKLMQRENLYKIYEQTDVRTRGVFNNHAMEENVKYLVGYFKEQKIGPDQASQEITGFYDTDDSSVSYQFTEATESEVDDIGSIRSHRSLKTQTKHYSQSSAHQIWSIQDYVTSFVMSASKQYMSKRENKVILKTQAVAEAFVVTMIASSLVAVQASNEKCPFSPYTLHMIDVNLLEQNRSAEYNARDLNIHDVSTTFVDNIITIALFPSTNLQTNETALFLRREYVASFVSVLIETIVRDLSTRLWQKTNFYAKGLITTVASDYVFSSLNEALGNASKFWAS